MNGHTGGGFTGRRLYCDHAATSFPKPPEVMRAMSDYAANVGASAGRGGYAEAQAAVRVLVACRENLNTLFNGENPRHFIFTLNCTEALNLAINGLLSRNGGHAITTVMDHNSILRPLNALRSSRLDIAVTHLPADPVTCIIDPQDVRNALRGDSKLIAIGHGSNVTGALQPIREIGKIAREANIPFLVDAAQSAGHVPINLREDCIDLLALPGHKGLLGPQGTGALYIRPGLEKIITPLVHGGTGSASELDVQPDFMPDKFESGSHNGIGLAGLCQSVEWILHRTIQARAEHDRALCGTFIEGVDGVDGLSFFGPQGVRNRTTVFSVQIENIPPAILAQRLENEFGILTRAGLHCAPLAHQHLKTTRAGGTVRLSFGPFLTPGDIAYVADALASIALENIAHAPNRNLKIENQN